MAEKLTFSGVLEPIEVEFLGAEFESAPLTRSVQKKAGPLGQKLLREMFQHDEQEQILVDEDGDLIPRADTDPDKIIDVLAKLLDLRLRSTNGSTKKPSTLVNERWKDPKVDFDYRSLFTFWNQFRQAEQPEAPDLDQEVRPT